MMSENRYFMGVDINPGSSPLSAYRPRYTIMIIDKDGRVVYKSEDATLARIIRLAWEYRVDAIGIDNIYELSPTEQGIARILSLLPPKTRLIQVTYEEGRYRDIRSMAEAHGVPVEPGKLTPGRTAYLAAQLARLGVGGHVRLREERTRITISRARTGGKGGWSQARYQRRLNTIISRVAQQVKEQLDNAGLDYDESYRRSRGGLEAASFTVYAGRDKIQGIVKPYEGRDYRIKITPLYSTRILIGDHDAALPQRPLIVGVDPGTYTGVAVLDMSGNVLLLHSSKNLDRARIASLIGGLGKPVVIAADVNPPPDNVRKLAAMFNAQLYVPPVSLSTVEKRLLAEEAYPEYRDAHQRDALAAAYKAYKELREKFKQVDAYISKHRINIDADRLKEAVVRGKALAEAVEEEIEKSIAPHTSPAEKGVKPESPRSAGGNECLSLIAAYKERIDYLSHTRRRLEREVEKLREELAEAEKSYRHALQEIRVEIEQERQIETYRGRIRSLESRLAKLESIYTSTLESYNRLLKLATEASRGDLVIGYKVDRPTLDSLKQLEKTLGGIPAGSILLLAETQPLDPRFAEKLAELDVEAVLAESPGEALQASLERRGIPVIPAGHYRMEVTGHLVFMDPTIVEEVKKRRLELGSTRLDEEKLELLLKAYKSGLIEK